MYDQQRQSKSIQCLTKYLQYFKTYFSLSFSLIECHTFPAKFTPVQLENVTQKITQKKFDIAFQQSPFNLWISDNAKSYVDRFYMRIVEFLEYRLNIFKAPDADQKLSSIINSFIGSLHKFFKALTSKQFQNNNEKIVIGQVFFQIEGMVRKLVNTMFEHLEKINQKSTVNLEEIQFSKKLINEQVFITFSHKLEELQKQCEIGNYNNMKGDSFSNEIYENGKMVRKLRSKSQFRVENFFSLGSKSLRESKIPDPNNYFNIRKLYPNAVDFQNQKTQNLTKKSVFAQNLSIMDIEDVEVYSRDYIMEELQRKNAINKQMIKKYIQVYKKKAKKHKHKAEFLPENETSDVKDFSIKKIDLLSFQTKSKSEINVNILQEKIFPSPPVPMIKGNSIFTQKNPASIETVRIQKAAKPLTQGNLSKALHILGERQEPKSRSETFRNQIVKKTTMNQNPEFETNRETFAYKEKQKMYFQSLKNKMTLQNQKITKKLQSIRSQNETPARKIDKISIPTIIETPPNDYRKMFRNNIKKNGAKGSSFLSNKTDDRIKASNSDIFSKNELTSLSIDTNIVSLQGSTLCKRMPKRGKLMKFLQNEDMINSTLADEINRASNKNTSKIQNNIYIEPDSSVLVLPRISSNKKKLHPPK